MLYLVRFYFVHFSNCANAALCVCFQDSKNSNYRWNIPCWLWMTISWTPYMFRFNVIIFWCVHYLYPFLWTFVLFKPTLCIPLWQHVLLQCKTKEKHTAFSVNGFCFNPRTFSFQVNLALQNHFVSLQKSKVWVLLKP